ncbi:MAG: hypothetical protein HFI33_09015 [Lachnospiraceae bacterium]|nr:hypothetical protein [Lachnospiraceae bacterium]
MKLLYEGVRRLMELVYGICGDYGIAIVVITLGVRLCLVPLHIRQRQAVEGQQGTKGCLLAFLQLPIMLALYNGIRLAIAADVATVLLPWIPSLLVRDSSYILPAITVTVQMLPQLMPYLGFFKSLKLQKTELPMLFAMLLMNGWFACILPACVELYYLVSGLFTLAEQITVRVQESKGAEPA